MFLLSCVFFFKQKTAYEMRISDWSSDVCSSDLADILGVQVDRPGALRQARAQIDLIVRRIYRTRRSCDEGALAVADMAEGDPHRTGQIVGKVEALVRGDVGRESRVERQARTRGSEDRKSTRLNSSH